uniref:Uncharacterized protein n=1 Tax=Molossus molossus TaxID=27622 RepID=A0A7J8HHA3_MOLMO|nr:hypothetical protein HJG59_011028 [Molossus molossus]
MHLSCGLSPAPVGVVWVAATQCVSHVDVSLSLFLLLSLLLYLKINAKMFSGEDKKILYMDATALHVGTRSWLLHKVQPCSVGIAERRVCRFYSLTMDTQEDVQPSKLQPITYLWRVSHRK